MASVDLLAWLRATDDDEDDRLADRLEAQFENLPIQVVTEGGGHNHPEIEALISEDSGFTQVQADALYAPIGHMHPGGGSLPSIDWGIQYVHTSGLDSNDGFSPYTPKATIEAAVGDLPDGGVVELSKGGHDVGDGLILNRPAPIILRGIGRWFRSATITGQSQYTHSDPRLFSSTGADALISLAGSGNAYGFGFESLVLDLGTASTYGILGNALNDTNVSDCAFWSLNPDATGIYADPTGGDDISWWRIDNSQFGGCRAIAAFGQQINNWTVVRNKVFGYTAPLPQAMLFQAINRCWIAGNDIEGVNISHGIEVGAQGMASAYDNTFIGNGGEGVDQTYYFEHASANTIIAQGQKVSGNVLAYFSSNSVRNVIIAAGRHFPPDASQSYLDDLVIDDSGGFNRVVTSFSGS